MRSKNILIVGPAPGPSGPSERALSGKAGKRLASLCDMTTDEFLDSFDTTNILDDYPGKNRNGQGDAFPLELARDAAAEIDLSEYDAIVLAGKNAAAAFGLRDLQLMERRDKFVLIPHPSGLNRWWNDPDNVKQARSLFLSFLNR